MESRNMSKSHARSQNSGRKPIHPFVCGTFRDFHAERDYLNQAIFPQLDALCRQRGLRFLPVDLRWNSKQGQATSEQTLRVCLDNVERCAPFFICMLGDRYGVHRPFESEPKDEATEQWLDKNFDTAAVCGYDWVHEEEYRYSSLTELEVVQASFRKKYDYGYFYFRNPEHLEDKLNKSNTYESTDQLSESEYAARKLKELKQQIIDTDLPVRAFKTPQELGELVLQDWTAIINSLHPQISLTVFPDTKSETFHQWSLHEAFAESRRKIFIRSPHIRELMDILNVHAEKDQGIKRKTSMVLTHVLLSTFMTSVPGGDRDSLPPILVLTGERGCGKSALVCNWLKQFASTNPEVVIIPHHVGCDAASSDVTNLMYRCTQELRAQYLNSDFAITDIKDITNFRRVTEAFNAAVQLGPSVILIDGANAFRKSHEKPTHEVKELDWLTSKLPSDCRLIITTVSSDITYRALKKRNDTYFIEVANLLDSRAQRNLLNEYVGANYTKFMDDQHFAKISSSTLRHLPLYYVSIATELRVLGAHRNAERQLEMYVHATTICDLWKLIIRRWTHDYGWLRPVASRSPVPSIKTQASRDRMNSGWVADALRLMAVARNGMTEDEILGALKVMGYANNFVISSAYWSMLGIVAQNALLELPSGLMTFSHDVIRNAVDLALLGNLTSPSQERVISPFSEAWERQKQQCHVVLAKFFNREPLNLRKVEELPWQLMVSGNFDGLSKALSDPAMFLRLVHNKKEARLILDLMSYCNTLSKENLKPLLLLEEMASNVQDRLVDDQFESTGIDSAHAYSSHPYSVIDKICVKSEEDLLTPIEVATILFHIGSFLKEGEHYSSAEHYLLSAHKIGYPVASVEDLDLMCSIQSTIGDLYAVMFDTRNAEAWYTNAIKTASEMTSLADKKNHESTTGHLFNQLAFVRMGSSIPSGPTEDRPRSRQPSRGNQSKSSSARSRPDTGRDTRFHQTVGPLLDRALKHMELAQCFYGISNVYFNMGLLSMKQHQWTTARKNLQTAMDMRRKWFGNTHPMVAEVIDVMGTMCWNDVGAQHDVTEPEKLYREALRMRGETLGPSHLLVASTLYKLGKLLYAKNTNDATKEARQLFQRALDIRTTKLGVYHQSTKAIRRALMGLETTDVALQFGTSLAIKEQPLVLLRDYKQQLIARSTSRLTIQGKSA
ncbi:hypothetical protein QZH41_017139 [Actinostola sp. cb2023]|nr:hypothetical protein QZH41_017139 [Actinostola sp. cb2023]